MNPFLPKRKIVFLTLALTLTTQSSHAAWFQKRRNQPGEADYPLLEYAKEYANKKTSISIVGSCFACISLYFFYNEVHNCRECYNSSVEHRAEISFLKKEVESLQRQLGDKNVFYNREFDRSEKYHDDYVDQSKLYGQCQKKTGFLEASLGISLNQNKAMNESFVKEKQKVTNCSKAISLYREDIQELEEEVRELQVNNKNLKVDIQNETMWKWTFGSLSLLLCGCLFCKNEKIK